MIRIFNRKHNFEVEHHWGLGSIVSAVSDVVSSAPAAATKVIEKAVDVNVDAVKAVVVDPIQYGIEKTKGLISQAAPVALQAAAAYETGGMSLLGGGLGGTQGSATQPASISIQSPTAAQASTGIDSKTLLIIAAIGGLGITALILKRK